MSRARLLGAYLVYSLLFPPRDPLFSLLSYLSAIKFSRYISACSESVFLNFSPLRNRAFSLIYSHLGDSVQTLSKTILKNLLKKLLTTRNLGCIFGRMKGKGACEVFTGASFRSKTSLSLYGHTRVPGRKSKGAEHKRCFAKA